jgi:hypothetical protein
MNGNTPDQAELREKIMELAEETPTIITKMDGEDYEYILVNPDDVVTLIAQQPSSHVSPAIQDKPDVSKYTFSATDMEKARREGYHEGFQQGQFEQYAKQPSSQAIDGYWICTDQLSQGGQKVMGPFVSQDYAFAARTQLEKLNPPMTYWIDRPTEPNETGRKV